MGRKIAAPTTARCDSSSVNSSNDANDVQEGASPATPGTAGPLTWIAGTIGAVIGTAFIAFVLMGICVGLGIQTPDDFCLFYPDEPKVLAAGPGATLVATEGCPVITPQSDVWFYYATPAIGQEIADFYVEAISDYAADHPGWEAAGHQLIGTEVTGLGTKCSITVTVEMLGSNPPDESDHYWQDRAEPPADTRSYYAIHESRTCSVVIPSDPSPSP